MGGKSVVSGNLTIEEETTMPTEKSVVFTLEVAVAPDFDLLLPVSSAKGFIGSFVAFQIRVASRNGFSGNVALSVQGLPVGASAVFSSDNVYVPVGGEGLATLTVTLPNDVSIVGTYSLTIFGSSVV